jgi:hypothetical protein
MEICGNTISHSSYKKRENEKQEKKLRNKIAEMEVNINENQILELENKKIGTRKLSYKQTKR